MSHQDCTGYLLQRAARIRLLTRDEEIILARQVQAMMSIQEVEIVDRPPNWERIVEIGQRAKEKMVSANLRLVISVAKKYLNRGLDMPDLIQEGNLGLIRGIEKFNPEMGYKLSTYVYWWIWQGITRAIAEKARTIRLPINITQRLNKLKQVQQRLSQELSREATLAEAAQTLELTDEQQQELLQVNRRCQSLDEIVTASNDGDTRLGELIADDGLTPIDVLERSVARDQIHGWVDNLNSKEKFVIHCRFGFDADEEMFLNQIAPHLGVTNERVRQIQNKAMRKLKSRIDQSDVKDFLAG